MVVEDDDEEEGQGQRVGARGSEPESQGGRQIHGLLVV